VCSDWLLKLAIVSVIHLLPFFFVFFFFISQNKGTIWYWLSTGLVYTQGPITWGGLARLARLARFAGISARLRNILKINFAMTWKNLSPASWDPGIAMPG